MYNNNVLIFLVLQLPSNTQTHLLLLSNLKIYRYTKTLDFANCI